MNGEKIGKQQWWWMVELSKGVSFKKFKGFSSKEKAYKPYINAFVAQAANVLMYIPAYTSLPLHVMKVTIQPSMYCCRQTLLHVNV